MKLEGYCIVDILNLFVLSELIYILEYSMFFFVIFSRMDVLL